MTLGHSLDDVMKNFLSHNILITHIDTKGPFEYHAPQQYTQHIYQQVHVIVDEFSGTLKDDQQKGQSAHINFLSVMWGPRLISWSSTCMLYSFV